jgi:hypothetical protein
MAEVLERGKVISDCLWTKLHQIGADDIHRGTYIGAGLFAIIDPSSFPCAYVREDTAR